MSKIKDQAWTFIERTSGVVEVRAESEGKEGGNSTSSNRKKTKKNCNYCQVASTETFKNKRDVQRIDIEDTDP